MRHNPCRLFGQINRIIVTFAVLASFVATPVLAGDDTATDAMGSLKPDDYRLFCGYMDALENDKVKKLKGRKRDAKIARMAKMSRKKLMRSVNKVKKVGVTCEEVGKLYESKAKAAVDKILPGRVEIFLVDTSDPSFVVAAVTWSGGDKKKVVQEAAHLAKALTDTVPIAKTIAVRAVNPRAKDKTSDVAIWFDAKTNPLRAANIDKAQIEKYADSRYIRVFDGVRCAKSLANEMVLGYRRGPCQGKSL